MADILLKEGDTTPGPRVQLLDDDGNPQSLVGATVQMEVYGNPVSPEPCVIEDAANGIVRVPRTLTDVPSRLMEREFSIHFEVTFSNGDDKHYPTKGFTRLITYTDINP